MAKAKENNKKSTKSFVMLIVTGITLVAVTLCWFVMSNQTSIEEIKEVEVENEESSFANIHYGVDSTGKIAIRPEDIVKYEQITENIIVLENMIPGAEYTYMAKFPSAQAGQIITLNLDGISNKDGGSLMSSVKLNRRVSLMNGETEDTNVDSFVAPEVYLSAEEDNAFEYQIKTTGEYRIFYSFKITDETTIEKENMSIQITNVDAVISDAQ